MTFLSGPVILTSTSKNPPSATSNVKPSFTRIMQPDIYTRLPNRTFLYKIRSFVPEVTFSWKHSSLWASISTKYARQATKSPKKHNFILKNESKMVDN